MYATTAIRASGAVPAYVEIDEATLLMDPQALAAGLGARTRAVIVTHLYGRLADVRAIVRIAGERGVAVIEDCAQAHGARTVGAMAGTRGSARLLQLLPDEESRRAGRRRRCRHRRPGARGEIARAADLRLGREVPLRDGRRE